MSTRKGMKNPNITIVLMHGKPMEDEAEMEDDDMEDMMEGEMPMMGSKKAPIPKRKKRPS